MKRFLITLITAVVFHLNAAAQTPESVHLSWDEPVQIVNNTEWELIDVDAWGTATVKFTIYNQDGSIHQVGYYTDGKMDGTWALYQDNRIVTQTKFSFNNRIWTKIYKSNGYDLVVYEDNTPVLLRSEQNLASN